MACGVLPSSDFVYAASYIAGGRLVERFHGSNSSMWLIG
jgi:hypothetical protein